MEANSIMTTHLIDRAIIGLLAGSMALTAIGCGKSPSGPTAVPAAAPAAAWTMLANDVSSPAILGSCLGGSGSASCFSGARLRAATARPIVSAPVLNNNQPVLNSGSTVTLSWTSPAAGSPIAYIIEASSTPGGPANLANFNTGNAVTGLAVPDVPPGTYYVRVRALDASSVSPPSNEVQVNVGGVTPGPGPGSCPSAPRNLSASQNGGTVTFTWQPPLTGAPASYVIQAGSAPNGANLANFDTASTALSFTVPNVPAGSYYVRIYGRSSSCAAPAFLTAASNEFLLSVGGGASGWSGQITCRTLVSGNGYRHDETQVWQVGGAGQTVGPRTTYPVQWSAQGSGGGPASSWTINATATTDLTVTIVASTGIPIFDRTTTPIIIRGGIVGSPTSFDLYEIDFTTIVASSATATSVSGSTSRPSSGGDSPQQPGGSTGSVTCSWSLVLR